MRKHILSERRNTMKRLLSAILALLLVFALVGCNEPERPDGTTEDDMNDLLSGNIDDELVDDAALTIIHCKSAGSINPFETVILEFEELYQVKVNVISYTENKWDDMLTKLLAQDGDFDLFIPVSGDIADAIRVGAYEDLSQYEGLSSRIASNKLVNMVSCINGTVIGVPYHIDIHHSKDAFTADTYFKYLYKNVNLFTSEYKDPDGEEYFEVLKHLFNDPEDTKENPYYDFDYYNAQVGYLFMNKYSKNKDMAEKFLCMLFDYANRDLIHEEYYVPTYPEEYDESAEYTPSWLYWEIDLAEPLGDAMVAVINGETDGSEEALLKLAQEAARGFRMRLEG